MTTTMKVCRIYDTILEETELGIMCERNGKEYLGALFFPREKEHRVDEVLETVVISAFSEIEEIDTVLSTYIDLSNKYGCRVYDSTLSTMKYWQYLNDFSDVMYSSDGSAVVVNRR